MPWMGLRSRPATNASHRRHSSIVETRTSKENGGDSLRRSVGALERLSLRLDHSNDESFSVLTHEPEELHSNATHERPIAPQEVEQVSSPTLEETEAKPEQTQEQERAYTHPAKSQRFSLLKFRNASDPQLSTTYRSSVSRKTPNLPPPAIITTSPTTHHLDQPAKKQMKHKILDRSKRPTRPYHVGNKLDYPAEHRLDSSWSLNAANGTEISSLGSPVHAEGHVHRPSASRVATAPPPYGDESGSALALPASRISESSRSDGSSEENRLYAQTTTTHTISTTTTFFRLPRRRKDKGPLFPLPIKIPPPEPGRSSTSRTPRGSTAGRRSMSPSRSPQQRPAVRFSRENSISASPLPSPTHSTTALTNAPFGVAGPSVLRKESTMSARSGASTPSLSLAPPRLGIRGRSSTLGSLGKSVETLNESSPTATQSGRTSTSTTGRKSIGDIFSLSHRLRQNSEPPLRKGSGHSPGTPGSKSNSLQITRESEPEMVYPQRDDSDTPTSYIKKLEAAVPRGSMATILCKSADEFSKTCLRKYMRGFSYFGDSMDMAVRKMLMEVELPKETQQIDRLLAGFADRYHECNPGIFASADETSVVAFSILLLHSDTHNKNNKRKMQKQDYVKNTQGPVQVSSDILECFYDNVCYTPFIHFEDEVAVHSHRLNAPKLKKSLIKPRSTESLRGPVDPYALILDNKLSVLRPSLKDVMDTEDTYSYTGTAIDFNVQDLHNAFLKSSVLQIVSARSRPDAFMSQATITNPAEAQAGLVSIKVAKVGLLWRKDPKKKKAKRPWQEWGAILTDSKLYFFKDVGWIKKLVTQFESYHKPAGKKEPLVFIPPLSSFEPDALMSMDDAVALMDSSYKKHKNAFIFIKHGGFEEVFLANSELEMNDWIGKLNYAATFRTAGVRMRGLAGMPYDASKQQMVRKDSQLSTTSTETQVADISVQRSKVDYQSAWEIMYYRRQIINEHISDYDEKLGIAQKELEHLLRNARHLQILLPIQAKSRETLILAAGRMSAKLKWTRIEVWRTKCHHDLLKADLEQEGVPDFPVPTSSNSTATATPRKITPVKMNQPIINRTNTDTSMATLSPTSTPSSLGKRLPTHVVIDKIRSPSEASQSTSRDTTVSVGRRKSASTLEIPAVVKGSPMFEEYFAGKDETNSESHTLAHKTSVVNSHRSKQDAERFAPPIDESEEQILREAGLLGVDGAVPMSKRPDTSGSEKDRVGAIAPEHFGKDRGGSVRRSLQRTLREPHPVHHTPLHHRSKRGRDSGSSVAGTDDMSKTLSGDSEELKRGTGSFIVHGKKASVVTFGTEWQTMSNEDRLKLKKLEQQQQQEAEVTRTEVAVDDGALSDLSGPDTAVAPTLANWMTSSNSGDTATKEQAAGDQRDEIVRPSSPDEPSRKKPEQESYHKRVSIATTQTRL